MGVLEGQGKFARFGLLAFVALEIGQQLAHKTTHFAVGNIEGCPPPDEVSGTDGGHALFCILNLRRPHHLQFSIW